MPRGGPRVRSGRPADEQAFRTDRRIENRDGWTTLPAAREGKPPRWPLPTPATAGGRKLWAALWKRGEAVMWEAAGQEIQVALLVLAILSAESPVAKTGDRSVAVSLMDDLGLSNGGRIRNRWRLHDPGTQAAEPATTRPARSTASKDRLLELVVNQ